MRSSTVAPRISHSRSESRLRLSVLKPATRGPAARRASASAFPPQATAAALPIRGERRWWERRTRQDVTAQARKTVRRERSRHVESFHQADGAKRQRQAAFDFATAEEAHLQAAAAEIEDQARRKASDGSAEDGFAHQAGFFGGADDGELDCRFRGRCARPKRRDWRLRERRWWQRRNTRRPCNAPADCGIVRRSPRRGTSCARPSAAW